jgi:hypothetical protein
LVAAPAGFVFPFILTHVCACLCDAGGDVDFEEFCIWFKKISGPNHGDHFRQLSWQGIEQMQIFVVNSHAQKFTIWVTRNDTIESVRAKMQDKEGHLHDDESVLTYDADGRLGSQPPVELKDGRTLAYYGIGRNAVINKQMQSPQVSPQSSFEFPALRST